MLAGIASYVKLVRPEVRQRQSSPVLAILFILSSVVGFSSCVGNRCRSDGRSGHDVISPLASKSNRAMRVLRDAQTNALLLPQTPIGRHPGKGGAFC